MPYSVWPSASTRAAPASTSVVKQPLVGALALAGQSPLCSISGSAFSTSFPSTENPISQGSVWVNGGATAVDWNNIQTGSGNAYAAGFSSGYDDAIACLNTSVGVSSTKHSSSVTVYGFTNGYSPPDTHEVQVHTGCTITSHSIFTYEFLIGSGFVRWNGAIGDWTIQGLSDSNAGNGKGWTDSPTLNNGYAVNDGDVFTVEYDSSSGHPVLTAKRNGTAFLIVADTTTWKITSGQPGMGMFARPGTTLANRGATDFSAASL